MKRHNLKFGLLILGILFLIGCTRTDSERIVGLWTATSIKVNSINVMNSAPYFTNVKSDIQSGGGFIAYSNFDTTSGTWNISSGKLNVYMPTDTFNYDYSFTDDTHLKISTTVFSNFSEYEFSK